MSPDERTQVLDAILKYDRSTTRVWTGISICPTSWLHQRKALKSSDEVIQTNWNALPIEEQLGIWLAAPDSDYEYVRDLTHIMKGSRMKSTLSTFSVITPAGRVAARPPVVTETNDPNRPISIAEGRAQVKRRKLTTTEFKAARAQATAVTGYDSTSPIYGKQLPEVIDMIEEALTDGSRSEGQRIVNAQAILNQLKARAVTRKLIGQAHS